VGRALTFEIVAKIPTTTFFIFSFAAEEKRRGAGGYPKGRIEEKRNGEFRIRIMKQTGIKKDIREDLLDRSK
jgi:hypothetical protein